MLIISEARKGARIQFALASDRGPIQLDLSDGGLLEVTRRPGSVTAILDAAARKLGPGLGWFAFSTDKTGALMGKVANRDLAQEHLGYRYDPVVIDREVYREYYNEAGARLLWPILHQMQNDFDDLGEVGRRVDPQSYRTAYLSANRLIAHHIHMRTDRKTPAIIHDYQLASAPALLRRLDPVRPIALFMHTPFPDPASLSHLPTDIRISLIRGILGADLVGFQSAKWLENFLDCCEHFEAGVRRSGRELRHGSFCTVAEEYPISPDTSVLMTHSNSPGVLEWERRLSEQWGDRRVIVRIERLDPSKNLLRALQAYELLLERLHNWRPMVHLALFLIPSRPGVPEYAEYARRVDIAVERLRAMHPGSVSLFQGHDMDRASAAMRLYDVLFVNSLHDGMNLVAQEGPILNRHCGAVVVSRKAGASSVLGGEVVAIDDPYDVAETRDALKHALEISPRERMYRAGVMRKRVMLGNPESWLEKQLSDLALVRNFQH